MKGQTGFTLLEVMVALAIMAVLSLLTAQALKSAVDNKSFVSGEISRDAKLADSMRIIRADIAQAFHYRNIYCEMDKDLLATPTPAQGGLLPGGGGLPGVGAGGLIGAPAATPKPCPPDVTGFYGNADSMYFTALSNVRTIRDVKESDQAKIGYFTKSCRIAGAKGAASKCLFRSVSPYLDDEIDKPGPETLLLEHVEEFKLRYLGPEREEFVEAWRTGKDGDAISKENFPYAVEVTLTIHDKSNPKDRPATQVVLAPIYFENNKKKKAEPTAGTNPSATPSTTTPPGRK